MELFAHLISDANNLVLWVVIVLVIFFIGVLEGKNFLSFDSGPLVGRFVFLRVRVIKNLKHLLGTHTKCGPTTPTMGHTSRGVVQFNTVDSVILRRCFGTEKLTYDEGNHKNDDRHRLNVSHIRKIAPKHEKEMSHGIFPHVAVLRVHDLACVVCLAHDAQYKHIVRTKAIFVFSYACIVSCTIALPCLVFG